MVVVRAMRGMGPRRNVRVNTYLELCGFLAEVTSVMLDNSVSLTFLKLLRLMRLTGVANEAESLRIICSTVDARPSVIARGVVTSRCCRHFASRDSVFPLAPIFACARRCVCVCVCV